MNTPVTDGILMGEFMNNRKSPAYREGFKATFAGSLGEMEPAENPHPLESAEHDAWEAGSQKSERKLSAMGGPRAFRIQLKEQHGAELWNQ